MPLLGTPVDAIDLAEDRGRFGALLDELGIQAPPYGVAHDADEAIERGATRSASPCSCAPPTCSAAGRWRSVTPRQDLGALPRAARGDEVGRAACTRCCSTASSRTRSSSTSTRSPTARTSTSPASCSTSRRPACTRATPPACCRRSASGEEMLEEVRRQTRALALRLGVVGLLNVQFGLVDNDRLYVIEANPRASRTVPFVSKAIGVPLAKVACRLILGERLADQDLPRERSGTPRERQGGGAAVPAPPRRRRAAGPGDEVDRRGDGHRRRLPGRVRQGPGRRRRGAAARGQRLHHRLRHRQAGRHAARRRACTTSASGCSRPQARRPRSARWACRSSR